MKKKLLSIITSVCLALSLTPVVALADTGGTSTYDGTTTAVAKIGEKTYETLAAAVAAAQNSDTVTLLANTELSENVSISNKSITLDLNTHTVTAKTTTKDSDGNAVSGYRISINSGGLTVTGTGTMTGGYGLFYLTGASSDADAETTLKIDTNVTLSGGKYTVFIDRPSSDVNASYGVVVDIYGNVSGHEPIYVSGNITATTGNVPVINIYSGAEITSDDVAAVYLAGYAKTTIESGVVMTTQSNVISIAAGELTIEGGTFNGGGSTGSSESVGGSITTTTCTALYIKQHSTTLPVKVEINGGEFNAAYALMEEVNSGVNTPKPEDINITINDGSFVSTATGAEAVSAASTSNNSSVLTVQGGDYSSSVDTKYLDESLTAELISSSGTDTPYSYYASVEDAENAAGPDDVVINLKPEGSVQIVSVGFKADSGEANEAATALGKLMGAPDTWEGITDCDSNTMYIGVLGNGTATSYKVVVTLGNTKYLESTNTTTGGSIVYFTFEENGGSHTDQLIAAGDYIISLCQTGESTEVIDTATISLGSVAYDLNGGTLDVPALTYYTTGTEISLPGAPTRSGYTFYGWSDTQGIYQGGATYTVGSTDVTLTALWTSKLTPTPTPTTNPITVGSAENGTVTASPESAAAGTKVTLTVTPDEGYELDTITVTDAEGNTVSLTANEDGTYTFTMPETAVDVTATFKAVEAEHNCPSLIFTDVDLTQFYHEALDWAVVSKVTYGTTPTTFSPNEACTRGQMACFLWNLAGNPETSAACPFTDVDENAYYYDAVCWAAEAGVTYGTSPTTFSPEDTCTRGQMACFIWNYAGNPKTSASNPFADVEEGAYYYDAVRWAAETKVTYGTSATTFSPLGACTRAEMVCFLWNYQVGAATN